MKALLQNIQGIRWVIFQTLIVMLFMLAVFGVVYMTTNSVGYSASVTAVAFAAVAFAAIAVAIAFALTSASAFAFAFAFAIASASAFAYILAAAIAFAYILAAAFVVANKYKIKFRFCVYIFGVETFTLLCAMTIWLPYLAVIITTLAITTAALLCESKLRLWLANNPPPEIVFRKYRRMVGVKYPYGVAEVIELGEPIPDPLRIRLHWKLDDIYA